MKAIGPKLVIATHNPGKLREIRVLLAPHGIECVGAEELDLPEPEETGVTFVDNAELKARASADLSGLPALADDSGLSVDALNGKPGIYSARWAEDDYGGRDFGRAMERVWAEIEAAGPDAGRDAHFVCALSLAWPDGAIESFEGKVHGTLVSISVSVLVGSGTPVVVSCHRRFWCVVGADVYHRGLQPFCQL